MSARIVRTLTAAGALALGMTLAGAGAYAGVTINSAVGGAPTGVNYVNFDGLSLGNGGGTSNGVGVSFTGDAQAVQGSLSGIYAAPFLSNGNGTQFGDANNGPDATTFITTGTSTVTLDLPGAEHYIGLLWGSVDAYNTLELYNGTTIVGTVTGANITATDNGNQGADGTYYVNINSSLAFTSVVMSSSQIAFEFDNVAYNPTAVPEPAALALFGVGLIGLVVTYRRRSA